MNPLTGLPAQFRITGALSLHKGDKGPPRFEMEVYDGGKLHIAGFKFPVVVDLSTVSTASQIKALLHHDTLRPVGHFERLQIGNSITGEGVLSQENDAKREVIAAASNGYEWESSLGAQHDTTKAEYIPAGKSLMVNGREQTGPFILARNAVIREASFVGAGGGENTSARIAAAARKWSEYQMATTIKANASKLNELITSQAPADEDREALIGLLAEAAGIDADAVKGILSGESTATPEQYQAFAKVLDVDVSKFTDAAAEDGEQSSSLNAESSATTDTGEPMTTVNRDAGDTKIAASLSTDIQSLRSDLRSVQARQRVDDLAAKYHFEGEKLSEIRANAITNKWDERQIELEILRASRSTPAGMQPLAGQNGAPATQAVINAALCIGCGLDEKFVGEQYGDKAMNEVLQARWRGFGLHSLYHEYLRAHGHHVIGGKLSEEDVRYANRLASQEQPASIRAAGGFSTFSLPFALGDFANKELQRSYVAVRRAMRSIAYVTTNTNFQPKRLFRLSLADGLKRVGRNGQLESVDLKEQGSTVQVEQWGRKLTVSYVDVRNDDASGLSELTRMFGALSANTVEREAAIILLSNPTVDGTPFFDAARGNFLSGANSALDIDALSSANAAFLSLKTPDDVDVTLDPMNLLVGPAFEAMARSLNNSTQIVVAGNADVARPASNPWTGMFTPIASRHLANGSVPNANGTQWLLTADPSLSGPIAIAYLDGVQSPSVKTWDSLPGHTGMQSDVVLNWGVNIHDPYSAVYSAGQ